MTTTLTAPAYPASDASQEEWDAYYAASSAHWKAQQAAKNKVHDARWTYKGLDEWLQGRNYNSRKLRRNTYLQRRPGYIAVMFHATDVVKYHEDGSIELDSGGWKTMTTKERISSYTPRWLDVYSERGVWQVLVRDLKSDGYWEGKTFRFFDGIVFGPRKGCRNPMSESAQQRETRKNAEMDKRIAAYVGKWIGRAVAGEMELPSNGDCWHCLMFPETDHEGESHLLSHMKDDYLVPSLILKAARAKGYNNPQVAVMYIMGLYAEEGDTHFRGDRVDVKNIKRLLTWYMRKHLRTNMAPPR